MQYPIAGPSYQSTGTGRIRAVLGNYKSDDRVVPKFSEEVSKGVFELIHQPGESTPSYWKVTVKLKRRLNHVVYYNELPPRSMPRRTRDSGVVPHRSRSTKSRLFSPA